MGSDFSDDFLRANANKDFICAQFTEVLRDLIRGVGVVSDPTAPVARASRQMKFVMDLLSRTEERISFYDLFAVAVERLRQCEAYDVLDEAILDAAKAGTSMLMEASCFDNAARGRTSRRERDFLERIEWIEEARSELRAK